MDPASVTTLITFAAQTSNLIIQVIQLFHHAPYEMLSLHNEVTDIRLLLVEYDVLQGKLQDSGGPTHGSTQFHETLRSNIIKVQKILEELRLLVSSFIGGQEEHLVFKRHVWLRKRSTAIRLRNEIAVLRQTLRDLIGLATASRVARIELQIDSFQSSIQGEIGAKDATGRIVDLASQILGTDTNISVTKQNACGPDNLQMEHLSSTISVQAYKRAECNIKCTCTCHIRYGARNPGPLSSVLGVLFVGYIGLPALGSSCNLTSCRNSSVRALRITYTFPIWFLRRTIDVAIGSDFFGQPELNIKLNNRVDYNSDHSLFQLARQGNVEGMKSLFERRLAAPNDVTFQGGRTAFDWAMQRTSATGDLSSASFLVAAGTDLDLKDDTGWTGAMQASELLLTSRLPNGNDGLQKLLSNIDIPELWDFTHLHNVVLGILPLDLPTEIIKLSHRTHIDATDVQGRTSLCWAALRGDVDAVQTLLVAGANLDIVGKDGRTALNCAIMSKNISCVQSILLAGGNVHQKDRMGENALSTAAWSADSPEIIKLLVLSGADPMKPNPGGVTPLQSTACLNHAGNAQTLIDLGSDPNSSDHNGDTPLFETIYYGCMEVMDVLLNQPIDFSHRNKQGYTILHVLALYANSSMLHKLKPHLQRVDINIKDAKGRTAIEVMNDRVTVDELFCKQFNEFWSGLEMRSDTASVDSWASALEHLP